MSVPTNYKQLRRYFSTALETKALTFSVSKAAFAGTPFYPFVFRDQLALEYTCPYCGEVCNVQHGLKDNHVYYCERCDTFGELTTQALEQHTLMIESLIKGIAKTLGCDCKQRKGYWTFGKMLIANRYHNVYFTTFPSATMVEELLADTGAILLAFNAPADLAEAYPHQLYVMADLQVSEDSLDINLNAIGAMLGEKPAKTTSPMEARNATAILVLESLLREEIFAYQNWYFSPYRKPFEKYQPPRQKELVKHLNVKGVKISTATLSRILNEPKVNYREVQNLYRRLQNHHLALTYKGPIHQKTIDTVNR